MSCQTTTHDNTVYVSRYRGDTLRLTVDLDGDSEVDVTGWTWLAQVRDTTGALVQTMTVTPVDPLNGVVAVELTAEQTGAMPVGDHPFDVEATDTDGGTRTVVVGKLRIRQDTSHA